MVANGGFLSIPAPLFNNAFRAPDLVGYTGFIDIVVANSIGAPDPLTIDPPVFTPLTNFGTGNAELAAPLASPIAPGGSSAGVIDLYSNSLGLPGLATFTVTIPNSDADMNPFVFTLEVLLGLVV